MMRRFITPDCGPRPKNLMALLALALATPLAAQQGEGAGFQVAASEDGALVIRHGDGPERAFQPEFTIFYSPTDPEIALRPIGDAIRVNYNVMTWNAPEGLGDMEEIQDRRRDLAGDGFDPRILQAEVGDRTPNVYHAMQALTVRASEVESVGNRIHWHFPGHEQFNLSATVTPATAAGLPRLDFDFEPHLDGWYSVAYTGAPSQSPENTTRIHQPFIWNENRFPDRPYMTLSFRLTIPSVLAEWDGATVGVLADPKYIPFQPLPRPENSQFGASLRNEAGLASPALFAPVPGGMGSEMAAGDTFSFNSHLLVYSGGLRDAYRWVAQEYLGFDDHRENSVATLNEVLHNLIEYGLSDHAQFRDEMKGCSYQTDVPGSVKNVSSLNPLSLALVTDDEAVYHERAYPILEFMMSREKTLFHIDPTVTTQSPSWLLAGPCAPVSELSALYEFSGRTTPVFLDYAKEKTGLVRDRDVEKAIHPRRWADVMAVYRATGSRSILELARTMTDRYIEERVRQAPTELSDTYAGGMFFWTTFTNRFAELYEIYQETGESDYLQAAIDGAVDFSHFSYFLPTIPDTTITVNEGGMAPIYWYMEMQGHLQMEADEEEIPAWWVSEIGLTPESSGTSQGHRAILMANHAPWLLRLSHHADGETATFLHDLARAAIVGRYSSFPGYHINTERTNIFMKEDYAWREPKEISYNSMHYNHIWPKASMILDFLVADAEGRSGGAIHFPSLYAEGYAYLKNKVYGHEPGTMYDLENLWLWMPKGLVEQVHPQLNHISARGSNHLVLSFTNQSKRSASGPVVLNQEITGIDPAREYEYTLWDADGSMSRGRTQGAEFEIEVPAMGIRTVAIEGVRVRPQFQDRIGNGITLSSDSWKRTEDGKLHTMVLSMGRDMLTAFLYSEMTYEDLDRVEFHIELDGERHVIHDASYPYEHTLSLPPGFQNLTTRMVGYTAGGERIESDPLTLKP